jgi:hypothetical protein
MYRSLYCWNQYPIPPPPIPTSVGLQGPHLRMPNPGVHPRICHIKEGISPGLNPGFGVLRFGLRLTQRNTDVTCTVVSMTPLYLEQRCQWDRCVMHSGFSDAILLKVQRCHWHRCVQIWRVHCRISLRIRSHIQKGIWWKKQWSKISCQGPYKILLLRILYRISCKK